MNTNTSNSQNNQGDWKQREVGALWKKVGANGKSSFCTGYIVSDEIGNKVKQRVIMFSNKNKNKDTSPDFIIYLSNEQEEGATAKSTPSTKAAAFAKPKTAPKTVVAQQSDDDEIPPDLA